MAQQIRSDLGCSMVSIATHRRENIASSGSALIVSPDTSKKVWKKNRHANT